MPWTCVVSADSLFRNIIQTEFLPCFTVCKRNWRISRYKLTEDLLHRGQVKNGPNMNTKQAIPLVEAMLLMPTEGAVRVFAQYLCYWKNHKWNTRKTYVSYFCSRYCYRQSRGTERMIINSLVHPTLKYIIFVSEESFTFVPGTNLLQAILKGFDKNK